MEKNNSSRDTLIILTIALSRSCVWGCTNIFENINLGFSSHVLNLHTLNLLYLKVVLEISSSRSRWLQTDEAVC